MRKPAEPSSVGVDRRAFLRYGALAGTAMALQSAPASAHSSIEHEPRSGDSPRLPAVDQGFELDELTVSDLQQKLTAGEETAASLARKYLARIEALDRQGPSLHALLETNPEALTIADALDAERKAGKVRGPLHGIPVLVKDNIDTGDKMMTTAGSLALAGTPAPRDAFIVARLREAGAVILGKTNLSEWANFRSTHSSSGWSGRGGQCRNPYALDRNPSGSSSGTGAAISANLAAAGVGSETDGSIVSPSNNCGLVGVKPTVGLLSRAGIIPISHTQDTAGPMTRSVRDAAIMLGAMVGLDVSDPATATSSNRARKDYTQYLDANGLKGARIGIARKRLFGYHSGADAIAAEAIDTMKGLGAVIVDPADVTTIGALSDPEFEVLLYEFKAGLNKYLAARGGAVKTLKDAIAFNGANKDRELPYFGQEIFDMAQKKGPLTDPKYVKALESCRLNSRTRGIDLVMTHFKLDALFCPTGAPAWLTDLVDGDHDTGGSSTLAAVAGYPHITVPAGFTFGLPVGVSFIGRAWSEPTLFKLAYAFEQATKKRRAPTFLQTADVSRPTT
jgi:amidase